MTIKIAPWYIYQMKGVRGQERFTEVVVDKIQTYFGYAIRNNKGNPDQVEGNYFVVS